MQVIGEQRAQTSNQSSWCDFSKFEAEDTATSFVSLKDELGINPSRAVDWTR
jgi:hypothetical protein